MDEATRSVYETMAATYAANRPPVWAERAGALLAGCDPTRPVLDAGSGTGTYLPALAAHPAGVVGVDLAADALELSPSGSSVLVGDLRRLPFAAGTFGGAWARNSYLHTPRAELPMALRELRRTLVAGTPLTVSMVTDSEHADGFVSDDDLPGRTFHTWAPDRLVDVLVGAGFEVDSVEVPRPVWVAARRCRSIADTVGPGMRLLVCGLNPSEHAADAGVGFVTRGNRFWPAARAAGLVRHDRDPDRALRTDRVGMTDLVKRATPRAAELTAAEYRDGLARVERLCAWLRPGAVCFVGLAGWRAVVDRRAVPGTQDHRLGGRPVHLMPSTSGLNARTSLEELTDHLRRAARLADRAGEG